MKKVWQYMINDDELYFTSQFRFPLDRVKQISLNRPKSGFIWIFGGILLLIVPVAGWSAMNPMTQAFFILFGLALLAFGIRANRSYEVGFVILKDPKLYEKVYVSILKTYSKDEAEQTLDEIYEKLHKKGLKVRKVHEV